MLRWVADYRRTGLPPEDGGLLSQTESFRDALAWFTAEMEAWEAKLGLKRDAV